MFLALIDDLETPGALPTSSWACLSTRPRDEVSCLSNALAARLTLPTRQCHGAWRRNTAEAAVHGDETLPDTAVPRCMVTKHCRHGSGTAFSHDRPR